MRKTIATGWAALFVAAALAPTGVWAQNTAAPAAPATPPAATATVPAKSPAKRMMTTRTGKFRNRHHRNMYWRTGGNNFRAMNTGAAPAANHAAGHNGSTAKAGKSGTAFVGSTATKTEHHRTFAGKTKSKTGTKTDATKNTNAKT